MNEPDAPESPTSPRSRPDLQAQTVGNDLVVYDPRARLVHLLNGTAASIFRMCNGRNTPAAMAEDLRRRFDDSASRDLDRDVRATLETLREKNLLL